MTLSELADQLRSLADQIEDGGEGEAVDGLLSVAQPGMVIVIDEACNERLILNFHTLVDEMLDADVDDPEEDIYETGYEPAWREWARILAESSKRIEAKVAAVMKAEDDCSAGV